MVPAYLAALDGVIRRRILLNYRVRPELVMPMLPLPFRPRLVHGAALVGVCAMRLTHLRPACAPAPFGVSSENAAHRIAVEWTDDQGRVHPCVYIPRRDTDSAITQVVGATFFPARHSAARFAFREDWNGTLHLRVMDANGLLFAIAARPGTCLAETSAFESLGDASDFFRSSCDGYAPGYAACVLDGVRLETSRLLIQPLDVQHAYAREFLHQFPAGSLEFDSAFVMCDIPSRWRRIPPLHTDQLLGLLPSAMSKRMRSSV